MLRAVLILAVSLAAWAAGQQKTVDLHFIDTEGGQATLIVTPWGESILVDAGWPGYDGRDAKRIVAAARKAGLTRIDYLLMTHYHLDHVGGVPQLAEAFPIGTLIDHGTNTETNKRAQELEDAYLRVAASGAKRRQVKPGDVLTLKDIRIDIVTARGEKIPKPLEGGGQKNPLCAEIERKADDASENARSIGFLLTFGKFRFVDLADLTWNKEIEIACPEHYIGPVDLFLTTHHGLDQSNPAAIVHGLRPRVIVMNNGAKKGGSPAAWRVFSSSPGLNDMWQLHYSLAGGKDANVAEERIANMDEKCEGHGITVEAAKDGGLKVTNHRNGHTKSYKP
ncbi:MAG: MBL fold metallo-hydrolase [Candidatus Solibacter sp.]|nr:MBL fold metallo-hydrolase [Candidatus Solibacter sp.]